MAEEDKAFFAYFRSVLKRYNISPSKATRLEYDFVTRVAESEFYLQKVNAGYSSLSGIAQKAFNFACVKSDIRLRIAFEPRWRNSGEALFYHINSHRRHRDTWETCGKRGLEIE